MQFVTFVGDQCNIVASLTRLQATLNFLRNVTLRCLQMSLTGGFAVGLHATLASEPTAPPPVAVLSRFVSKGTIATLN